MAGLGRGDGAARHHRVEDESRALRRGGRLIDRAVVDRRLHQRRQHRRLTDGEALGRLVEEAPGRRLEPIGARAEIDAGKIEAEDLLLAVGAFQLEGEQHLLALALQGALGTQVQVARQLLGDGRGALGGAALNEVADHRPGYAERIDAAVLVEPPILDGDEGGGHVRGQGVDVHRRPIAPAPHPDHPAGAIEIDDLRRPPDRRRAGNVDLGAQHRGRRRQADHDARTPLALVARRSLAAARRLARQ